MANDSQFLDSTRKEYAGFGPSVVLGAPVRDGRCHSEPMITLPLATLNRHGLIAGATGTGKTKTLQLMAEQLAGAGVPVFLGDVKGDLSGMAAEGVADEKVATRARDTGYAWRARSFPVEFLSLSGKRGAQLRATVSSFGPLLLAKVLSLNETQTSVLTLVFKYCDDHALPLLDFADLRAVLQYLTENDGVLRDYGGISKASVGVLLRDMIQLEQQGAGAFFGEPEFDLDDLFRTDPEGRGLVSVLELADVQDKPALWSTFVMWMLARIYNELPEVGDRDKPKLVFFFDEAHLLFDGASRGFLEQVEQVVRLIRSKGIGVFFVSHNPRDLPPDVLGQLSHRVQHALRAYTPADEKALKAAVNTLPRTDFYDLDETLTALAIGEAVVSVLGPSGVPTRPVATRLIPPASRMGPLTDPELARRLESSDQVREYAHAVDRESAREMLAARMAGRQATEEEGEGGEPTKPAGKQAPSTFEQILRSPLTRSVATAATRGILGALLGTPSRRRRRYRY